MYRFLRIFIVLLMLLGISGALCAQVKEFKESPFLYPVSTVILDAGHGGHDPGALIRFSDYAGEELLEKEIVLDITKQVAQLLRQWYPDLQVILTRNSDDFLSLQQRADIAARTNPGVGASSIFISIHANSSNASDASGVEFLVKRADKRVRFLVHDVDTWTIMRYANHTVDELNQLLNRANILLASQLEQRFLEQFPTVRNRGIKEQDIWVLNAGKVPSVLIEIGFLSNPEDAQNMQNPDWRSQVAHAIARGIADSLNPGSSAFFPE